MPGVHGQGAPSTCRHRAAGPARPTRATTPPPRCRTRASIPTTVPEPRRRTRLVVPPPPPRRRTRAVSPARPPHHRRLLRRSRRREEKLRHGIERALARGDHRTARYLQSIFLKSFAAKHCAAHEANRKLRPNRRLRRDELVEVASNTSVFRPCDEPVDLYPRRKGPDSYRPITDPGIENRTRQKLVVRAMEPATRP